MPELLFGFGEDGFEVAGEVGVRSDWLVGNVVPEIGGGEAGFIFGADGLAVGVTQVFGVGWFMDERHACPLFQGTDKVEAWAVFVVDTNHGSDDFFCE